MAILVDEWFKSRPTTEGDDPQIDLIFKVVTTGFDRGHINEDLRIKDQLALLITAGTIPSTYDGLVITGLQLDPDTFGIWTATIPYGLRKQNEIGDTIVRISTTGGTHHITQSLGTVNTYQAPGEQIPAVSGINDQGKGQVQGVDIQLPAFSYNVTTFFDPGFVTAAYISNLFLITASVNTVPWKIFQRGEALFMGGTLTQRSSQPYIEASFEFIGSVNASGLTIGDITGIVKRGHEYLWARYRTIEDGAAKTLIEKPIAAYVEQVYPYATFADIGIGV